jgi:hypothetical protein
VEAATIPLRSGYGYNVHYFDHDLRLTFSRQESMDAFDKSSIMGKSILEFMPPGESVSTAQAIRRAFENGHTWHSYSVGDFAFLWLIQKIDNSMVAVHEVYDNPADRSKRKRFLLAASGNFYKRYFREDAG